MLQDKGWTGWLTWPKEIELFLAPPPGDYALKNWDLKSAEMIQAVREIATTAQYWEDLSVHFSEENHADVATQDNISCVKSICKAYYKTAEMFHLTLLQSRSWKTNHSNP